MLPNVARCPSRHFCCLHKLQAKACQSVVAVLVTLWARIQRRMCPCCAEEPRGKMGLDKKRVDFGHGQRLMRDERLRAAQSACDWRRGDMIRRVANIPIWGVIHLCECIKSHEIDITHPASISDIVVQSARELWKPLINISSLYAQNKLFFFLSAKISFSCLV